MTPAVGHRERLQRSSPRSISPRRRSSPRRERSPAHRQNSPRRRSPQRTSSSHRARSPAKEKLTDRAKSPKHSRPRSPVRTSSSLSPSPRTKHLKRAQTEREGEKMTDRERGRNAGREEHYKGRQREHGEKERTSSSHSPSPRTKRLMRAKTERGAEKIVEREHGKDTSNKGRHGEHEDVPSENRSVRDKKGSDSSRSSRRDRPVSPEERNNHRRKHGSRSPPRGSRAGPRDEATKYRDAEEFGDDLDSIARMKAAEESLEAKDKDKAKPSFELSGKLAEETNRFRGVTLLFNEPADARKPDIRWRLYVFKAGEVLNEPLYVHRQSCYLFGRERRVADIPTDHPSCSKQHAVIQYRLVEKEKPDGLMAKQPRICDTARELCRMNALACRAKFSHRQLQDHHLLEYCVCSSMLLLLLFLTHQHPLNLTREQVLLMRDDLVSCHTFLSDFVSSQSSSSSSSSVTGSNIMRLVLCMILLTSSVT